MNKSFLIGNLASEVELRTTQSGKYVAQFRLAVQRKFTNQQGKREADFISIIAWNKLAETCAKYLRKGRKACVIGSIQTRDYVAQDGSKRYVTEIVAEEVEFLDTRQQQEHSQPTENQQPNQDNINEYHDGQYDEPPF